MPKVIVEPGRIRVLEPVSPYDAFVLGRERQMEDIDMFVRPMERDCFDVWWGRLEKAGFWCINAGRDDAWALLVEDLAPRFAKAGEIAPNVEVKFPKDPVARRQVDDAWDLELLGVAGNIADLADQVAFKMYMAARGAARMSWEGKDAEDALHIGRVAGHAINWDRAQALAFKLGVDPSTWQGYLDRLRTAP